MTTLAFFQYIGPLEWLVLSGCILVPVVGVIAVLITVFKRRSNLEARIERLEQINATRVPPR